MEENKRFRNHISVIIEQIGAGIVALAVVAVSIVLQNVEKISEADMSFLQGKGVIIFLVLVLFLVLSVGNRVFAWANTYICIEDNAIVIERGKVSKKKNTIGIPNISNINLEQNLFEMILGTCKVKLDTNSRSTADSTDVKIVLKKADASRFKAEITRRMQGYPEQDPCGQKQFRSAGGAEDETFDIRAEFGDVFQHGVFSVNIFSLLILIGAVIGTVTAVLHLLEQPYLMSSLLGAAAGIVVAAGIILSALWDTVKDFIRYYDFRAKRRGDKIYIKYGFLKKMEYMIPVDKIQALRIRQSFLARVCRRYMAEIVNVGMGDEKEEQNSFLILYATEEKMREQLELLLPEFALTADQKVERLPASVWAAWAVPGVIYAAVACSSAAVCTVFMEEHTVLIWLGAAGLIVLLLIGMVLKYLTDGSGSDGTFLKLCHGYFGRDYISVRYSQIQYMEIKQNFVARAFGMRKGKIHLLASAANTAHGIPYFKGNEDERIRQGMLGM